MCQPFTRRIASLSFLLRLQSLILRRIFSVRSFEARSPGPFLNHRCSAAPSAVIRLAGSFSRSLRTKSWCEDISNVHWISKSIYDTGSLPPFRRMGWDGMGWYINCMAIPPHTITAATTTVEIALDLQVEERHKKRRHVYYSMTLPIILSFIHTPVHRMVHSTIRIECMLQQ